MSATRRPGSDVSTIGPYRLATRIAVGGMAEVFRALKTQSAGAERAVVIKRMLPALAAEPEARTMFEREAELGMAVRDPHVVEVIDRGVWDDAPFLVLEYVFGVDLARLLRWTSREHIRIPPKVALWIATELLAGLESVHNARDPSGHLLEIVHRDVSPSNVFLSVHGDVKLGDLGIAQALRDRKKPGANQSAQGRAKGKLGYLAPEQVRSGQFDARSDVFAAGVVIAEAMLGRALFVGATHLDVLLAIREADVSRSLSELEGRLEKEAYDALIASLERDPEKRVASAAEFRRALLPFAESAAVSRGLLGPWVAAALDAHEDDHDRRESLARTIEQRPSQLPPRRTTPPAAHRPSSAPPGLAAALRGTVIGPTGTVPVFERAIRDRRTGVMTFQRGAVQKQIYFASGAPLYVSSNQEDELLGERLLREGYIGRAALDLALHAMGESAGLGDTLVDLGLIDPLDLFRAAARQVDDKLFDLFTWESGRVWFEEGAAPPALAFPIGLKPTEIMARGREVRAAHRASRKS